MTDDEAAFLTAIAAARHDRGLRGVYADWLDEHDRPVEADYQRRWTAEVGAAEDWLAAFGRACGIPYPDLLRAGRDFLRDGTGYVQDGFGEGMRAGNTLCDTLNRVEFWRCWELVTGEPADVDTTDMWKSHPFSCDCGGYDDLTEQGEDILPPGVSRE